MISSNDISDLRARNGDQVGGKIWANFPERDLSAQAHGWIHRYHLENLFRRNIRKFSC